MSDGAFRTDLDADARRFVGDPLVPGISVAVVDGDAPIWTGSYGVRATTGPAPVEEGTLFEAASLSKPLTAYGVLLLVREGRIQLDQPLDALLPAPYLPHEPAAAKITVRMALTHTTGYPNWRRPGERLTLVRASGVRFGYSGEAFVQLERVVEHVTGRPFADYLHDTVLTPLGLTDSTFAWTPALAARTASGHTHTNAPVPKPDPTTNAASSLHTTATDFARYVAALMDPAREGPLTRADVDAMLTPQVRLPGPLAWGLGWGLDRSVGGEQVFWHWGDNPGFKAFAAGSPARRTGVVVLTNGDAGINAAEHLVQRVLPALCAPFDLVRDFRSYTS